MPLLMGCTTPSPAETAENVTIIYDPILQKPVMDLRMVGTYSLKCRTTSVKPVRTDRKNEIDDTKYVK